MSHFRTSVTCVSLLLLFCAAVTAQDEARTVGATREHKIILQPRARYTDRARQKGVEGAVRLRLVLEASGQVGNIEVVKTNGWRKREKYGLTAEAIKAAQQIKFEPKIINGVPVSVTVTREYLFTIY